MCYPVSFLLVQVCNVWVPVVFGTAPCPVCCLPAGDCPQCGDDNQRSELGSTWLTAEVSQCRYPASVPRVGDWQSNSGVKDAAKTTCLGSAQENEEVGVVGVLQQGGINLEVTSRPKK